MKKLITKAKFLILTSIMLCLISCNYSPKEKMLSENDKTDNAESKDANSQFLKSGEKLIPVEKVPPEGLYILNNMGNNRDAIKVTYEDNTVKFQIGEDKFNLVDDASATMDENGNIIFSGYPTTWYSGDGVIMMSGTYFRGNSSDEVAEFVKEQLLISGTEDIEIGSEWDEPSAINIMKHELDKYPNWSDVFHHDSIKLINNFQFMSKFIIGKRELISGLAYTTWHGNTCKGCKGVISLFEFENRNGWRLTNKGIAFSQLSAVDSITINQIGENKYGMIITNLIQDDDGEFVDYIQDKTLYTFVNEKLLPVLSISHKIGGDDNYRAKVIKSNKINELGYYYLMVEETEESEDGNIETNKTMFAFSGNKYEEFDGYITDPALTSINRFIDINSLNERSNDICPTCHGTGEIICPLCGGTGVNNMGIECGCIRNYNMEKVAGHTPSHPPLRWTCPACGGTGKPS